MKTKHTPGPWKSIQRSTGDIHTQSADGVNVALVTVADYKRQAANARLIAAAPEMLEALEHAQEALCEVGTHEAAEALERIDSLIARIEGATS